MSLITCGTSEFRGADWRAMVVGDTEEWNVLRRVWPGEASTWCDAHPGAAALSSVFTHWSHSPGRDWGQEEKGTTEDEMAGWHH